MSAGVLGLLLAPLFVALNTRCPRREPAAWGIALGESMGIILLMIRRWMDFNLRIPANALTFAVLLAMGQMAYSVERRDRAVGGP